MNILFVCHHGLSSNSGIHIGNLCRQLHKLGVETVVAVPEGENTTSTEGRGCQVVTFDEALQVRFSNNKTASFIHAWTPRQNVARATRRLAAAHECPYVVHLEDNEHVVAATALEMTLEGFLASVEANPGFLIPEHLAHPAGMRSFIARSAGVTALIQPLMNFKPDNLPSLEIWPAAEDELFFPQPVDQNLRRELGIELNSNIIVYHGNVHAANVGEVRTLYLAVGALHRRGIDIKLVRLGDDFVPIFPDGLPELTDFAKQVARQPREEVPHFLALADLFVQPGRVDEFNSYRFPSKLPEFFAMGRPVILPATNFGLMIEDGSDGVLLRRGDAIELAGKIIEVLSNRELQVRLAEGSRKCYERLLSWQASASKLLEFYNTLDPSARPETIEGAVVNSESEATVQRGDHSETPAQLADLRDDANLERVGRIYGEAARPDVLSYATVGDFVDSIERLPALSTINQDLKDVQRPWVLKAILSSVPRGSRLLEIGAGDPWVADLLARLGYQVTIVDPYDGRDRGPVEFRAIKTRYPHIRFVRGEFPDAIPDTEFTKFDCIYSISVLEHLNVDELARVFLGISRLSARQTSLTIHAIDHVLLGNGDRAHHERLLAMARGIGLSEKDLNLILEKLRIDPEAYFLSAEAHNRWRGATPYVQFPMRRCVSMQICAPAIHPLLQSRSAG